MQFDELNFFPYKSRLPWRFSLAYIDATDEYHADDIFYSHNIPFRIKIEMESPNYPELRIIFCSFPKKKAKEVLESLFELDRKMTILYGQEYLNMKQEVNKIWDTLFLQD